MIVLTHPAACSRSCATGRTRRFVQKSQRDHVLPRKEIRPETRLATDDASENPKLFGPRNAHYAEHGHAREAQLLFRSGSALLSFFGSGRLGSMPNRSAIDPANRATRSSSRGFSAESRGVTRRLGPSRGAIRLPTDARMALKSSAPAAERRGVFPIRPARVQQALLARAHSVVAWRHAEFSLKRRGEMAGIVETTCERHFNDTGIDMAAVPEHGRAGHESALA